MLFSTTTCAGIHRSSTVMTSSQSLTTFSVKLFASLFIMTLAIMSRGNLGEAAWQENLQPRIRINRLPPDRAVSFRSEQSADHFRLLDYDDESLLIGARNFVYNVSSVSLSVQQRIEWRPSENDTKRCRLYCKQEDECHNYIRIIVRKSDDRLLICGTNAYKPKCREYVIMSKQTLTLSPKAETPLNKRHLFDVEFKVAEEMPGEGLCPYDANHNSTYTFADGDLYTGTVGQFSGADPLIYRTPLRTVKFDPRHLNAPQFVSSMHLGQFVYFFFRENAVEFINCGKAVYSRVARVCTNDQGGPHVFKNKFTSFLKARLNCSMPGDIPFYFNELQSTSAVVHGSYVGKPARLIYSVFTTGLNSILGSAVCAFRLEDIEATFNGPFKGQDGKNSNWLRVVDSKVPEPRPGTCVNESQIPDETLNFIASHPLMDEAVPSYWGRPVVVRTGFTYRYTYIAVDPQVEAVNGNTYDVLFIGTDHGHVLKVVNLAWLSIRQADDGKPIESVIVEDVDVFGKSAAFLNSSTASTFRSEPVAVTNLVVRRSQNEQQLIIVSDNRVQGIPLYHCDLAKTCSQCVQLQDPYCAWSPKKGECTHNWQADTGSIQSIEHGKDNRCSNTLNILNLETLSDRTSSVHRPVDTLSDHTSSVRRPVETLNDRTSSMHHPEETLSDRTYSVHRPVETLSDRTSSVHRPVETLSDRTFSVHRPVETLNDYTSTVDRASPTDTASALLRPPIDFPNKTSVKPLIRSKLPNDAKLNVPLIKEAYLNKAYREITMVIACVLSIVLSLLAGFVIGFLVGRSLYQKDNTSAWKKRYVKVDRMAGLISPDLTMGGTYAEGHCEPAYALTPGMNRSGLRPCTLALKRNEKLCNHPSGRSKGNLDNSFLDMNNSENSITLHKAKRIYL
ncbi:semaphorin-1A-like isoform X2 [Varroa jacobsoni]|uniref:semaphorin-1A-like isoform X2 n=1 Tax=Varroa jacobsoni TaxID=62625 RepID=UPI000BF25963|nr:semaphorin-1A-like isoform X2 [Varroa jacobsoni]